MSLDKLVGEGVAAVDSGDEQVLAQAILDLNAKLDAAVTDLIAKLEAVRPAAIPTTLNITGGQITIEPDTGG